MENILITIVVPAYNYAHTLQRAIDSVMKQKNDYVELLVINDGSTDNTVAVLECLYERYSKDFRFISKENGGLSSVRNLGISEARGQYVIFLDADDEMTDGAIDAICQHIIDGCDAKMIVGGHVSVQHSGARKSHVPSNFSESKMKNVENYLINNKISMVNGACVMHKDVFAYGKYPEKFRNSEDIPVFAQVLSRFACSSLLRPIVMVHKHDDSMRHNITYNLNVGLELVDEIFLTGRMPPEFMVLMRPYRAQRCLSLFRSLVIAGKYAEAKQMYRHAISIDWRVIFKYAYSKKATRIFLRY